MMPSKNQSSSIDKRKKSSSIDKRKKVAEVSPQLLAPRSLVFSRLTYTKAQKVNEKQQLPVQPKIKEVMVPTPVQPAYPVQLTPHAHVLPVSFPDQSSKFEMGTISTAVLTKTQRKNRNRRIRRRISLEKHRWIRETISLEKQEKEDEVRRVQSKIKEVMVATPVQSAHPIQSILPVQSAPHAHVPPVSCPNPPSQCEIGTISTTVLTNRQRRRRNRRIKISREKQEKEDEVMHEISPLLDGSKFHAVSAAEGKEGVEKIAASPPRPPKFGSTVVVQPSSMNKQRFARESVVSNIVNGYDTESEVPPKFRRPPKEDKSSILSDEPQVQDHTLTSLLDEKSLSHTSQVSSLCEVKKVWRPKFEAPSILLSTSISHASSKAKGKEPLKVNDYQKYVPSPINQGQVNHGQLISGKSIEELMNDLRESLCKMEKEDFDKDNDNLTDEDMYGVNTRRNSSLPGDSHTDELLEVKVEEDRNTSLIQLLIHQVRCKDEYIMKIEKIMEEMTTTMTGLTAQLAGSQQTPVVEKSSTSAEERIKTSNTNDEIGNQDRKDYWSDPQPPLKDDLKELINQQIIKYLAQTQGNVSLEIGNQDRQVSLSNMLVMTFPQ